MKETRSHQRYNFKNSRFRASVIVQTSPGSEQEALNEVNRKLIEETIELYAEVEKFTSADIVQVIGINEPLSEGIVNFQWL